MKKDQNIYAKKYVVNLEIKIGDVNVDVKLIECKHRSNEKQFLQARSKRLEKLRTVTLEIENPQ